MLRKVILALLLAAAALLLAIPMSCNKTPASGDKQVSVGGEFDLNNPPPPPEVSPIGEDIVSGDAETIWKARCGLCHDNTRGLDKYKGEAWEPIIQRMIKKPGSMMNAAIAGIIYVYLYEKTTGKYHPDRERLLSPPVNTAGTQDYVGGRTE